MSYTAKRSSSKRDYFLRIKIKQIGEEMLPDEENLIEAGQTALVACGWPEADGLSTQNPTDLQLMAEMVNLAAKSSDWEAGEDNSFFYQYKAPFIRAALEAGAEGGWGNDGCFYLYTPAGGVNCFHDPYGELREFLSPNQNKLRWEHEWSGVYRQNHAFSLAQSRQGNGRLLRFYALVTKPARKFSNIERLQERWMKAA